MDPQEKQELRDSLKQSAYKISKKVEAEKDAFRIEISNDGIKQFYRNIPIITVKAENLSTKALELINKNPEIAATTLLDQFAQEFDASKFEKKAASGMDIKTAANETLDEMTWQMITQKQLDDQRVKLHPRTDEYPNTVTQKQLPEAGLRPGTYDVTTEAQLERETTTFFDAPRTAGQWKEEDRNIVTEGQLDKGAKEYSELGTSDREQMGAKFDGGPQQQGKMTTEKQLAELLKHHKWTEPLTTTEGKDQLKQQDGDLSRITAEVAEKIVKEALHAMGRTVISAGVSPEELVSITSRLVSHESKYPVLVNVIRGFADADISAIDRKIARAKRYGKVANATVEWPDETIAEVLVKQLAKMAYSPKFIVEAIAALSESDDLATRINTAAEEVLAAANADVKVASNQNISIFKQVLSGNKKPSIVGDDSDGLYAYHGVLSEVTASADDLSAFEKEATELAKKNVIAQVGKELKLEPAADVKIDKTAGTFCVQLKKADELSIRAAARRRMLKKAQMGGMGGMGAPAGDQMGNPAPPAGPADMGAPPGGESLTQEPPLPEEEEEGGSGEPKPPGTLCAACGSEDVDIDNGTLRCQNCGAEGTMSVQMQWNKWPGTIEDTDSEEQGGAPLGQEGAAGLEDEQETAAAEGGATMPNVPVGASVRVTPFMLEKLAAQNIRLGSVCPNCGSKETNSIRSAKRGNDSICWECGQPYHTQLKAIKGKKGSLIMETVWVPKSASSEGCSTCTRLHKAFVKSLKDYGMSWDQFDRLAMKDQAKVVVKMANTGMLDLGAAMDSPLPIHKFAASTKGTDKFPKATCREKIARRFGEMATAMSGPCQGKKLMDCVCEQLESLGVYSDGLAAKVASAQASQDPMLNNPVETCVKMLANEGLSIKEACVACDGLRAAYATAEDLIIETIAQSNLGLAPKPMQQPMGMNPMNSSPGAMKTSPMPMKAVDKPGTGMKPMMGDPAADPMGGAAGGMGGKALEGVPDPQDDVVTDMGGDGEMGGEMGMDDPMGGMGDMMGGMGGMDEHPDTVSLLMDIAEDFSQLAKALAGDIDGSMIENGGEGGEGPMGEVMEGEEGEMGEGEEGEMGEGGEEGEPLDGSLDVSDVTEDVVDGGEEGGEEESEETDIPGVSESPDGGLEKDSKPCGAKCGKTMSKEKPQQIPVQKPAKMPQMAAADKVVKEASAKSQTREASPEQRQLDDLLFNMKRGTIKKSSEALDSIFDSLMKIAAKSKEDVKKVEYKGSDEGSKVKAKPAQDTDGIGKFKDGGKMGHEEPFSKGVSTKPDVPRKKALMGDEGDELTINETGDMPKVPRSDARLDGEENYKSEKGNSGIDGNQGGLGKGASKKVASGCKCGKPGCKCNCGDGKCGHPCGGGKPCNKKAQTDPNLGGTATDTIPDDWNDVPEGTPSDIDPVTTKSKTKDPLGGDMQDVLDADAAPLDPQFESFMSKAVAGYKQEDPEMTDEQIAQEITALMPDKADQIDTYFRQHGQGGFDIPSGAGDRNFADPFAPDKPAEPPFGSAAIDDEDAGFSQSPLPVSSTQQVASQKGQTMKVAKVVDPTHKIYGKLVQKIANGETSVKLTDGNLYDMQIDAKKNVVLAQKIKESQTVSPKVKKSLEDDPDINQSSGPGKGKVKQDKPHSLAVDEKKPSEGMGEPSVPKAPNGGRLQREHTVEKATDGPNIPAGGGSNPEYDTVEKYAPEKLDETLGKDRSLGAIAENHELAVKIAGKLLKANKITVDELPQTIDELSKKSVAEILDTFEGAVRTAETTEGIQKTASTQAVENLPPAVTNTQNNEGGKNLQSSIQDLFTLNKRNEDYARYSKDKEARLWH
jgi:hypothetical protein